jgi:hypothetical protein
MIFSAMIALALASCATAHYETPMQKLELSVTPGDDGEDVVTAKLVPAGIFVVDGRIGAEEKMLAGAEAEAITTDAGTRLVQTIGWTSAVRSQRRAYQYGSNRYWNAYMKGKTPTKVATAPDNTGAESDKSPVEPSRTRPVQATLAPLVQVPTPTVDPNEALLRDLNRASDPAGLISAIKAEASHSANDPNRVQMLNSLVGNLQRNMNERYFSRNKATLIERFSSR